MVFMEFFIGTSILLFLVLVLLVVIMASQSLNSIPKKKPIREDLRRIKAQIEDSAFI